MDKFWCIHMLELYADIKNVFKIFNNIRKWSL